MHGGRESQTFYETNEKIHISYVSAQQIMNRQHGISRTVRQMDITFVVGESKPISIGGFLATRQSNHILMHHYMSELNQVNILDSDRYSWTVDNCFYRKPASSVFSIINALLHNARGELVTATR